MHRTTNHLLVALLVLSGCGGGGGTLGGDSPTVNGWPSGSKWLSAQGMVDHANLRKSAITNRVLQDSLGIDVG